MEAVELDRESVKVYNWRLDWLVAGGFTKRNARLIAETDIDWRYAVDTLKNAKAKGHDEEFVIGLILD